ncbi:MAG: permease [Lachnospiraceae bacterium]|nr:permease [Lachnospiraceae bacterium]
MLETIQGELVYIWYYFDVQLRQIFMYWVLGMLIGSLVSVFAKEKIHKMFASMQGTGIGTVGILLASALGILSPLCMYGTIPIAASFYRQGMREDWLAAFMMSSVLLNPQLLMYSTALGTTALLIRLLSCYICGVVAGMLVGFRSVEKPFFHFDGFSPGESHDTDPNPFLRFLKNLGRNIKATGVYFLIGILLSALFQRYVPSEQFAGLFGAHRGFGVLLAATIGVPLYACGGGTIPLLQEWLMSGMSLGSAAAFMITGPATKITNLGALKIVLGLKHFAFYIAFVMVFSLVTGLLINLIL